MVTATKTQRVQYMILHGEQEVAWIDTHGHCGILDEKFMPFNLYLEETDDDIDVLVSNITNFYYWCATRVLPLDRKYAKEILNSIGASQALTDRDRARIALSYHCLCLTDIYWVREKREALTFAQVNLYDNHLSNAFVSVALRGRQITVQNDSLTRDLSTNGCFPKAWLRKQTGFELLKDGGRQVVENEVLASKVCQCFECRQVTYTEGIFEGEPVSVSTIMTNKEYSIVSREAFEIYARNQEISPVDYILQLDAYHYYMMNVLDYLVGNTDRHWGNWGFLVENRTNQPVSLHPLMDFNQSFQAYDGLEGANCQTTGAKKMSQKEAAQQAVSIMGINQIREIDEGWFVGREQDYDMLQRRLDVLR